MGDTPFLPYAKQDITDADIAAVTTALKSPFVTRGETVQAFEEAFARECGAAYAVSFNSGSSALSACYHAVQLTDQDRVFSTPNTFVSTISAAIATKARVVLVDVDPATGLMDVERLSWNLEAPTSRGRSIVVPVHYSGATVDVAAISELFKDPEALIIEDAAHALGASYADGTRVGSCQHSALTVFSLHPAKHITTGEGGMVTTNDPELYHRLTLYRNNFLERDSTRIGRPLEPWEYEIQDVSGNFHLTEFQAALGLSQLARHAQHVQQRRALVKLYRQQLKDVPNLRLLPGELDDHSAHHLMLALIDFAALKRSRAAVMAALKVQGIGTQVHYIPLYKQPFFQRIANGDMSEYFPHCEAFYSQVLTLPLFPAMEEGDVQRVGSALKKSLD